MQVYVHVENSVKLLSQLQNAKHNVIDITESRSFIPEKKKAQYFVTNKQQFIT